TCERTRCRSCPEVLRIERLKRQAGIVDCTRSDEYTSELAPDTHRVPPGILKCTPHDLQEQSLLRVDIRGLTRRYSKWAGIETADVSQISTGPQVLSMRIACAPAFPRRVDDAIAPLDEQRPKSGQVI